ncbi:phosphoribosylformylglycinamidine synthase subunit PurQ [Alicyclobacillus tolerans]|uniref:Phosphoribosylformylglycinamidine synthase subunit PurQ n=1 Tax=Alicyclobacillus tolerans TaxID=90970 RepID=A0ABT9LZC7_9BACL|nr:phosphoribosylformylglycinamidine synthase subunit PurQ [Alicyclobacillus tengchongensis]MDP9729625.1 phosphoribosylformylglycinamidine synthase [Alicyclobacillus tengchongensis]
MKWAVIVFPGSNCDEDAQQAIIRVTGDEATLVWHQETSLADYDAIVLPGGFSYGDYLRSGAIARFAPIMKAVRDKAVQGTPIIGICNGFQVLTEAHLLPGALLRNRDLHFHCKMVELRVETNRSPFTAAYQPGDILRIPIAHGEGRYFADSAILHELQEDHRVAFRYVDNPNGSSESIAGILSKERNVLGLMPHPERAVADFMRSIDGAGVFRSIHQYVTEREGAHAH